ncbi:MAG: hypothetical protein Q7V88_02035, partial [Actinomycetota bacterium]|nr:hypothetical protein [Actinomycetota bacterium]
RDLGQILARFQPTDPGLQSAVAAVDAALNGAVVQHLEGPAFAGVRGLSVYAPISIQSFDGAYQESTGSASWSRALDAFYNAGADSVVNTPGGFLVPPTGMFSADGVSVVAGVDPALIPQLTEISLAYGIFSEGEGYVALGEVPGAVLDAASGLIGGNVPLMQYSLSVDGFASEVLAFFSVTPSPESDLLTLDTPVAYRDATTGDEVMPMTLRLIFDAERNLLSAAFYLVQENGTMAEFTPAADGSFETLMPFVELDGTTVDSFIFSSDFDDPPSLPAQLDLLSASLVAAVPGDGSMLSQAPLMAGISYTDAGGTEVSLVVPIPTVP